MGNTAPRAAARSYRADAARAARAAALGRPTGLGRVAPRGAPRAGCAVWVRAIRIRQWPKNLLVFGAPAAAGALERPGVVGSVCQAALAFCLLASGAYLINDLRDAPEDRRHPVKRRRPIASGAIAPGPAVVAAGVAIAAGLILAGAIGAASLAVAVGYIVLNFS